MIAPLLMLLIVGGFGWSLIMLFFGDHIFPPESRATQRANADLARHQAHRAIDAGMVDYQLRRNGDRIRDELRWEMDRLDELERWEALNRWSELRRFDA